MEKSNKFAMVPARIEPGISSTDTRFGCVVTLCVKREDGGKTWGGGAVLIAPNLAITTSHCVSQWQPNLSVISALTNQCVAVKSLRWRDGTRFDVGNGISNYPGRRISVCDEDLVLIELDGDMVGVTPARPQSPPSGDYLVEVAADVNGTRGNVMVATLKVIGSECGLATAIEFNGGGFPYASGAPALLLPSKGAFPDLVGIQVGVTEPLAPSFPVAGVKRSADIMPMTAERIAWLDTFVAAGSSPDVSPGSQRPDFGGIRTAVARHFVIQREDGSLHSEDDCLVEFDDLNFFHGCSWSLIASGSLHLLTTGGTLWTRRVPGTNQIKAQILIYDVGPNQGMAVDVDLVLIEHNGDPLWLMGSTYFDESLVYVYLYRTTDDSDTTQKYRKRVRLEAYVHGGVHIGDRPENHTIVFDGCSLIESMKLARSKPLRHGGDPVQDDVANGHEGHKP
jgi:hypothetical protein